MDSELIAAGKVMDAQRERIADLERELEDTIAELHDFWIPEAERTEALAHDLVRALERAERWMGDLHADNQRDVREAAREALTRAKEAGIE